MSYYPKVEGSEIIIDEDGETLKGGYHLCPICLTPLSYRTWPEWIAERKCMETYIYCTKCDTQWETPELLEAYREMIEYGQKVKEE